MQVEDIAFWVGVAGDAVLQILVRTPHGEKWGLKEYFDWHGPVISLFVAGAMMYAFTALFVFAFGPNQPWTMIFLYGMFLDVYFRLTRIVPTLDAYYNALPPFNTMVWGGIPAVTPYLIRTFLKV